MSRSCQCVVLVFVLIGAISSWAQNSNREVSLRRSEVKQLVTSASTPAEFERLATYFKQQSQRYELKEQREQKELDELHALRFHAKSYGIQVETTQNRRDYDRAQSKKCADEAAQFRQRAKELSDQIDPAAQN